MNAPIPINAANIVSIGIDMELNPPKATICAVRVVPISLPKITVTAWFKEIISVFKKPKTMTLVTPDECVNIVVIAPMQTPNILLFETFENKVFKLLELIACKLPLKKSHATKNVPIPAISSKMWVITSDELISIPLIFI